MIHETLNPVKTDAYPSCCCPRLTDGRQSGKVVPAVFNQAASRRKLLQLGRQAVSFAHRAKAVFFTPAFPLHGLFPMVNRGKARLVAAATNWQFPTPCPLFATPNRRKFWAALNRLERGFTMQTQAARSGFLSWQQDTLPEIHGLIKQIKRAKGYRAARAAIVSAYEADSAAYGHIAAAIRAQIAIDRHNRAKSTFPLAGVWIARITHARQAQSLAKRFHVSGSPKDGTQADTHTAAPECVQDGGDAQAATSTPADPATAQIGATSLENGALPSGFLTHWQNGVPAIEAVIAQITPQIRDYKRIREHIRAKFSNEWAAYGSKPHRHDLTAARELATAIAQERADAALNAAPAPRSVLEAVKQGILEREHERDMRTEHNRAARAAQGLPPFPSYEGGEPVINADVPAVPKLSPLIQSNRT